MKTLIENIKQLELLVFYLVDNNAGRITLERMFAAIYKDLAELIENDKEKSNGNV